jgi:hypothetical protein
LRAEARIWFGGKDTPSKMPANNTQGPPAFEWAETGSARQSYAPPLMTDPQSDDAWGFPAFFVPEDAKEQRDRGDYADPEEELHSLLNILFGSCKSIIATASFFTRFASACRSPMSNVNDGDDVPTAKRRSTRPFANREGETVSVPVTPQDGFHDDVSALSAITLDCMVPSTPQRAAPQTSEDQLTTPSARPRNGDVLLPTPERARNSPIVKPEERMASDLLIPSPERSSRSTSVLEQTTFETMERFEQAYKLDKDRSNMTDGSKQSQDSNPHTISTSGSSSEGKDDRSPSGAKRKRLRKLKILRNCSKRSYETVGSV